MATRPDPTRQPRSRPPSVHLNLNVRGIGASATVAINERSNALRAEGKRVFKLGLGQSPFPVPESVVAALQAHAHEKDYLPVAGLGVLREAVAAYHTRVNGVAARGEDVLIGPGSKELMFILQLAYYGDLVVPTPSWVSYVPQARIIGRHVRLIPTTREDDWLLKPERLDELCSEDSERPRLVILNYPSNPTGGTYRLDELKQLARVARKHGVLLLSDEIYGALHFRGQHVSIARFYPEGTIISSGLSKWCGAGGWRIGTFLFPPGLRWLLDAMAAVASETYTSTSAPIQHAAVRAFEGGEDIDDYLRRSRRVLRALGVWAHQTLVASGVFCVPPAGAFYLFPDFSPHREGLAARGIHTSQQLCERILDDTGVAMLPGSWFGRVEDELTLRLALVDFDGARALEEIKRVPSGGKVSEAWLAEVCTDVVEAIRRVVAWLENAP